MTTKETIPTQTIISWLEDQIEDCDARIKDAIIPQLADKEAKRAYEKTLKYIRRLAGES